MKDFALFATKERPLRCSGLDAFVKCNWRTVAVHLADGDVQGSGQAADTGSALHAAVEAFHKGATESESICSMNERRAEYPLADLLDAAALFLSYAADPRNRAAKVVLCEQKLFAQLPPAPTDPTGAPIELEGTVDQVREEDGGFLRVWDSKTSRLDPSDLLNKHMLQIAGYCKLASVELGRPVDPGGLIVVRRYPKNVFFPYTWRFEDLDRVLLPIRHLVALVRSGVVWHSAGDWCTWCGFRTPDLCLPAMRRSVPLEVRS